MSKILITRELFENMDFDNPSNNLKPATISTGDNNEDYKPTALIVFANSDVNSALYHLNQSLNAPFDKAAIATVLIQESIKENFVGKLRQQLKAYNNKVKSNKLYHKAMEKCIKLNAQFITVEKQEEENLYQPTVVCDFTHKQLSATSPSGIVTLHTFRTVREAITLVNKESLKFNNISIWHENHSHAYDLVAALKSKNFFINCFQISLNVLEESVCQNRNYITLDKSYHYETLQHDGIQKSIVFPVGSIFAN